MSFHISTAHLADAAHIVAFNQKMALETENRRLAHEVIAPGVHDVLSDPHKGLYLLAKDEAQSRCGNQWSPTNGATGATACLVDPIGLRGARSTASGHLPRAPRACS